MTPLDAQEQIAQSIASTGLPRGCAVLVHSSLSSLGHVPDGAETVIRGLLQAIGPGGTLLLPALSYKHVHADHPVFDVLETPSNVGAISEHFRTRHGTLRSVNPTHSVCATGPDAEWFLKDHALDETPCGSHSPYRRLQEKDGWVLFLGCGLRPNTSMHAIEELVMPPYLFGQHLSYKVILPDHSERTLRCCRHDFSGWKQRYDRLAPLLHAGELKTGQVLQAAVQVLNCRAMWNRALGELQRNPFFFVEKIEGEKSPC